MYSLVTFLLCPHTRKTDIVMYTLDVFLILDNDTFVNALNLIQNY